MTWQVEATPPGEARSRDPCRAGTIGPRPDDGHARRRPDDAALGGVQGGSPQRGELDRGKGVDGEGLLEAVGERATPLPLGGGEEAVDQGAGKAFLVGGVAGKGDAAGYGADGQA